MLGKDMAEWLVRRVRTQVVVVGDTLRGVLAVLATGVGVAGGSTVFVGGLVGELGESAGSDVGSFGCVGAGECEGCGEGCGSGLESVRE